MAKLVDNNVIDAQGGGMLDNLHFNLFTPTCDVEVSQDVYTEGETITANVFRLVNASANRVPVEVNLWLTPAASEPSTLRKRLKKIIKRLGDSLDPGFDKDFGPVRLAKVKEDMPIGPTEIVCRLIDPRNGGVYDVDLAPFEIE